MRHLASSVLLALVLASCSFAVEPSAETRVLYVANRVGSAALLQGANTSDGVTSFSRIVTACGGQAIVTPARNGATSGEYSVAILLDPTGALDQAIERQNGNLAAVDLSTTAPQVYWLRSGLRVSDLPQWITITPDGVTLDGQGPAPGTVTQPCPSFGPTPEPSTN